MAEGFAVQLDLGPEQAGTRKAALGVLAAMLQAPDLAVRRDGSPALTPEYCESAMSALTCHELVQLLDWPATAASAPQLPWCATVLHHFDHAGFQGTMAHMRPLTGMPGRRAL